MSNQFSYGLKINGLKLGAIAVDGGPGLVLTSPGKSRENTVKVTPTEPTETDIFEEGVSGAPAITISKLGVKEIAWDLLTFDKEVIADLTGGSITGDPGEEIYHEPREVVNVEKTLKLTDTQEEDWLYPRVKITASLVGVFTTNDVNVVRCKARVLTPTKDGVSPFMYGKQPSA